MARNIKLTPYDEQIIDAFDQDASGPQYTSYGSTPSTPTESYFPSEDTMPLFLSEDPEAPRRRGFGTGAGADPERSSAGPRVLKLGIFAASAAAIAFAFVSVENPLALFANAKASLNGTSLVQAGVPVKAASEPSDTVRLASAEPTTAAIQPTVSPRTSLPTASPAATNTPTRDEIAAALRNAHQSQPEIRQPPPTTVAVAPTVVTATPPARHLAPDELAALLKRARGLIEVGDIAPARLLLERAADAQEATAALLLAETYDPAVLGTLDMRSITPDPAMARDWYQKAARLGSQEAQQRLAQIQN